MKSFEEKCLSLENDIDLITKKDSALAFSGGVDSALLLKLMCDGAKRNGTSVYAVTVSSMLNPVSETVSCKEAAENMGAVYADLKIDELDEAGITDNPKNRCYLCKKYMFGKLCSLAKKQGAEIVTDGTNYDDLHTYRPGLKALEELGILSPLARAELTKPEVRKLAEKYGIKSAKKPSSPCMATRFPYGTHLTYDEIEKAEKAEAYIKNLGFYNVRVRVHKDVARIEVDAADIPVLVSKREDVAAFLKKLGYKYVTLDLDGFLSGSMDR